MDKGKSALVLLLFVVLSGAVGYGWSQLMVQRELHGTVSISAEGDLGFFDDSGVSLSMLDFGEIPLHVWVNRTVTVRNIGNVPLNLTCARTDDNNPPISTNFAYETGEWFNPSQPKTLEPEQEITVVVEVMGNDSAVGVYSLAFTFYGEG